MRSRSPKGLYSLLLATLCLPLVVGCGGEEEEPFPEGQPEVGQTWQSACKPEVKGDRGLSSSSGSISSTADNDTVTVAHVDAYYNCASRLKMEATLQGGKILVQEVIMNPGELARCMCDYDLSVEIKKLAAGTYQVEVVDTEGQLVGSSSVTVGGGQIFKVGQTLQSNCKGQTFGSGSVKVAVQGHSATILHEDATYNCAAKLQLNARLLPNNVIEVQEIVTNPHMQANCICSFDLSVSVTGLAPGSYTVMVLDAQGQLVDTVSITV
jgi:hypothetical protein